MEWATEPELGLVRVELGELKMAGLQEPIEPVELEGTGLGELEKD